MVEIFETIRLSFKEKNHNRIRENFILLIEQYIDHRLLKKGMIFHPLGFIYSKLHEFTNKETIRLHIWDKERWYQEPLMDIHNHYYTVNSFVLIGRIKNILYVIDETKPPNYAIYRGSYGSSGDRSLLKTENLVSANISKQETILRGESYQITTSELHSSFVEAKEFTCTLVYTETPGSPTPLILGPLNGDFEYKYPIKMVNVDSASHLLTKLLTHMQLQQL